MLERLIILAIVVLATLGIWWICCVWQRRRIEQLQEETLPAPLAQQILPGSPAVLYFTTESCVQCKLQQSPVLERFAADTGIAVHKLDAVVQQDLAAFYNVMTVPTTVVLDRQRRPVAINYGLAPLPKLRQQLEAVP
ncbi:MAG: thioredoxin family protein [Caldilineaceae bacterium]|nr:thioredoxin family protein [Caldilineaceae bacterium]